MKKNILLAIVALLILSNVSFAQDSKPDFENHSVEKNENKKFNKEERQKRYNEASHEQKMRMDRRKKLMKNLTPEQRELIKKERERHRQEMQKIIGAEMPEDLSSAE